MIDQYMLMATYKAVLQLRTIDTTGFSKDKKLSIPPYPSSSEVVSPDHPIGSSGKESKR